MSPPLQKAFSPAAAMTTTRMLLSTRDLLEDGEQLALHEVVQGVAHGLVVERQPQCGAVGPLALVEDAFVLALHLAPPHPAAGRHLGSTTPGAISSNTTSRAMPFSRSSCGHSTTFEIIRGPSAKSTRAST